MYSDRPFVIYLAGKMTGLTKEEMNYWRTDFTQKLYRLAHDEPCRNVKVINPVDYYNTEDQDAYKEEKEFVRWELRAAMNADLVVADTSDSLGTMSEVTAAFMSQKPVILFRRDLMSQTHPFMAYIGDREFEDVGEMAKFVFQYYIKV